MIVNTREVAAELDVTPKALRRFLRRHPKWKNAGIGNQYHFSKKDLKKLRKGMDTNPARPTPNELSTFNQPGISVEAMLAAKRNPKLKAAIRRRRAERHARLNARLEELNMINAMNQVLEGELK